MIEGLKVTVDGVKLKALCRRHSEHHRERAAIYAGQIKTMRDDKVEGMNYTGGDPVKALEDRQRRHLAEADELQFISDNLNVGEHYLLGRDDLVKLGITKSPY